MPYTLMRITHLRSGSRTAQSVNRLLLFSAVNAVLAFTIGLSSGALADGAPEPVVIEMGDTAVTGAKLDERFRVAVKLLAHRQGVTFSKQHEDILERLRLQYLDKRASELVMLREATRRELRATDEDVMSAMAELFPTARSKEAVLSGWAEQKGEAILRQIIEDELTIQLLTEELLKEIPVAAGDVITLHHDVKESLARPAKACVRHIQARTEESAREILAGIQGVKDFADVAVAHQDTISNSEALCFEENRSGLGVDFEKAVFAANAGDTIGPVQTGSGFHIVKIERKEPSRVPTLNEAYSEIEREIALERLPGKIESLVIASGIRTYPERYADRPFDLSR